MKIRQCFVSNSSSSSFVICQKLLTQEQVDGLREGLNQIAKNEVSEWGERGGTWEEDNGYFYMETFWVWNQIDELFKKPSISWSQGISIEG